jgi:hypothetical protein
MTVVLSKNCAESAVSMCSPGSWKNASNTSDQLGRQNRFGILFHLAKSLGQHAPGDTVDGEVVLCLQEAAVVSTAVVASSAVARSSFATNSQSPSLIPINMVRLCSTGDMGLTSLEQDGT